MSGLIATGIEVYRSKRLVLSDVSFSIDKGELVGLIGPNGAGKSTLLRTMVGLSSPEKGNITFNGIDLNQTDRSEFAKKVSYLEQEGRSYWPLSVENLVMLGRMPFLGQWRRPSESDWNTVREAMNTCDVLPFSKRTVTTLSGGEQARVMLARSLATEPEILLADEPVAGLDPSHQLTVMDKLRQLADDSAGVVVVMHDLSLAARYCDRLSLLSEGKLVAEGPPKRVLNADSLMRYYGISAHFGNTNEGMFVIPTNRVQ